MDVPNFDNFISDCLIKFSAPASMPHVGCEIINNSGLDKISLPITYFCKFPPDKLEALELVSKHLTLNKLIIFLV